MKKFLSIFLSIHIAVFSVFASAFVVHAETLRPDFKKPFWGYFDDIVSTGMNLPTLLKYVGGVLLNDSDSVKAVSLFDDYLVDNSSRFGVNYQTYEEFVDSVLNASNGVVTITPKGQEIVKEFTKYFVDSNLPYFYVTTSVVRNRFAFGFGTEEAYNNFKDICNSYSGIAFITLNKYVNSGNTSTPFYDRRSSVRFFDPYNDMYAVGGKSQYSIGSIIYSSDSNDYASLYSGSIAFYNSDFERAEVTSIYSSDDYATYTETTNTSLTGGYIYIIDPEMATIEILNGYNTSNYPRYSFSGSDYRPAGVCAISFDNPKVFRVYNSFDSLRDSIYSEPSYYTTPQYYVPIASNNSVNVTVLNENIYNSTPTYNEVYNYSQTYYQENGDYPSANITYEYITNYYYAGSDNSTSGGDNGGSGGGGGIFDFLGDLGSVLGSLISGLGNLVTNLLSALTGVFDTIANVIPDSMNTFFSTFFSWLPPEWISLITLSITLGVVFGLIKLIRG